MKKILSVILTLAIIASMATSVFAEAWSDAFPGGEDTVTVTGGGNSQYVDTIKYRVVLPTAGALQNWNFVMDPQGLLSTAPGSATLIGDLKGGQIYSPTHRGVINNSSVPLVLTMEAEITNTAHDDDPIADAAQQVVAVSDPALVHETAAGTPATALNMLLYVEPSGENISALNDLANPVLFKGSGLGYPLNIPTASIDAVKLTFDLDAADYVIINYGNSTFSAEYVPGTGKGTAFKLGGYVNRNGNWSSYSGTDANKVGIEATFTFVNPEGTKSPDNDKGSYLADTSAGTPPYIDAAPGLRNDTVVQAITPVQIVKPVGFTAAVNSLFTSVAPKAITVDVSELPAPTEELVIPFNFGDETLKEIILPSGNALAPAGNYTVNADDITFSISRVNIIKGFTADTVYRIILTNDEEYIITFEVP